MLKDPLIRRFISASVFAGAFIWVAVRYFHVETEVVWVLFIMSFVFVGVMMAAGLIIAPLVRLFRSEPTLLGRLGSLDESGKVPDESEEQRTNRSQAPEGE